MRCCAPGCKNDSRPMSKSQDITFHVFPTEPQQRKLWLEALGKLNWEPKERSVVCSEHFLPTDLYETRCGLRKVRAGAKPVIMQDMLAAHMQPDLQQVCRICLATDRRMLTATTYGLEVEYLQLTGLSMLEEHSNLPPNVCYECCQRLKNCSRFRDQSLKAHTLLMDIVTRQEVLSFSTLKSLQQQVQTSTYLHQKHFEPNHYDLILIEDKETNNIDLKVDETKEETPELEIKHESSNIYYIMNETEQILDNDNEIKDLNIESDLDINFDVSENSDRGFSSDDSLPLERRRTKKKSVKKTVKNRTKTAKIKRDKTVKKRQVKKDPNVPKIDRRRKPFLNNDLNETLFTITDLTVEEQIAEIEKRQDSANYKNAVYKCTECYKGFLDEDAYNTHMTRHTNQCGDHQCDICKTHFKHQHALRKHITAHHTQRFSCNQCPYVTTHRQTARLHERWHKGTKYQCPHCPDEFVKFTTYMGHIRIKHPSDFVCQLCGYSFVSEKGIDLHKKLKHRMDTDEIPSDGPLCESCNIRFVSDNAYRQHLKVSARHTTADKESRESNKPKKRKSKDSGSREKSLSGDKDASEDSRRMYPSQIRKAEGPIACEQCGIQLSDSRAYHGHFRRAHPDKNRTKYPSMKSPCMCEVCGRMFQSYALLKDHTWVHTGERPFKCDACGKSFRMKQRLVTHRRVHSQMKATYICNLCGKHFSTHSNRQRHMFIHTGLKPFKCEMCGKGFKHASEKRAHITYVHLKKPWPKRARGKRRDSRQGIPQPTPTSDMSVGPSVWPACDPKMDHTAPPSGVMDKHMYYNLKI